MFADMTDSRDDEMRKGARKTRKQSLGNVGERWRKNESEVEEQKRRMKQQQMSRAMLFLH